MKPIETVYNGYRFRSRLEARWAVFFDTLHVVYRYEAEGYDLEGVWYLPDFWLPELDCWVEIKAKRPTDEEQQKARFLSWGAKKLVYIFYGDVWMPDFQRPGNIILFQGANATVTGEGATEEHPVALPLDCLAILVELNELGVGIAISRQYGNLLLCTVEIGPPVFCPVADMLGMIKRLDQRFPVLVGQLEQKKDVLLGAIETLPNLDSQVHFHVHGGGIYTNERWIVCAHCDKASIMGGPRDRFCFFCKKVRIGYNNALLTAYTTARQARFEGRRDRR